MGSAAEITEPTTGTEKHLHHPMELEEEDEQIVDLVRKTSSFCHGKERLSTDSSTITTTTSSSSSSSSGDGTEEISDFPNLKVPESPEKETVIGFHEEEHEDGNKCNVFFDGEQGSESAAVEPDVHSSQIADGLNGDKKESEFENGSTSEDNKRSREIEEVQHDGGFSKNLDAVDQPTDDVIEEEEELEFEDVEYEEVENVLDKQETHDLYCPNCDACITKKVVLKRRSVLKRRKRIPRDSLDNSKRPKLPPRVNDPSIVSGDNSPSPEGGEHESFMFKCLSCFTIFLPKVSGSKPLPDGESVEGLQTQQRPREEATSDPKWFRSIFQFGTKESAKQQVGATSTVAEVPPRGDLSLPGGSTANIPLKPPVSVQGGAVISTQVAKTPDTVEEPKQQNNDKDDASVAEGKNTSGKVRLSPIKPSHEMNISSSVVSGPGVIKFQTTILHPEGTPPFGEAETSVTTKPDYGQTNVTDVVDRGDITGLPSSEIDIPPVSLGEDGTLVEPLILRPVVEGRKIEILKSIVYGGLIESITSLGVISSAAGSGATMLNILVLGIANLLGGLIVIIHNLQELRDEEPKKTTTENNQTNVEEQGRYKRLLGHRDHFTIHASVAILSFIIVGLLPPVVYYFSFNNSHSKHIKDYKVASVFGASLLCIVLLAIGKAHAKSPRGSYLKSALYYAMISVSVSGISYAAGNFVDQLLEKYGWSDGTKTPAGQMMVSLMGRKAGSFGYASSY